MHNLNLKKPFERVGFFTLLIALLVGCMINPTSTKAPAHKISSVKPTSINVPSAPGAEKNHLPPVKVFSLQKANKIPPEDILLEIDFGGQGGNDEEHTCEDTDSKSIFMEEQIG